MNPKERAARGARLAPRPSAPPPAPTPCLLVAEDFAIVEDLNLEHLVVVDAAGHWPPEGLGREGQLWSWVEMTGRGVGTGRGSLVRCPLTSPQCCPVTKFRPGASLNSDYHLVARVVWLILLSKMALGGFW